ncbi:hypothetical protein GWI33_012765 [Rhynchophorus ferrugineus]|uniref:C2H2-type domain-containing protein n=1 Tax=Rhynchophorus ferrugineus TaxID=354439 RepID=A0A834MN27_RHYFE|nr:hypothetical protein GWI33_012765 [Rhynchophorus ferrugineus]
MVESSVINVTRPTNWRVLYSLIKNTNAARPNCLSANCLSKFAMNEKGWYECLQCQKVYKVRSTVLRHIRLECNKLPSYSCYVCKKLYRRKEGLMQHFSTIRHKKLSADKIRIHLTSTERMKPYYCNDCKKSYRTKNSLSQHYIYECAFKNHYCMACHKSYKTKKSLKRHFTYECGKMASFKCDYCPYVCKRTDNLKKHTLSKHLHCV